MTPSHGVARLASLALLVVLCASSAGAHSGLRFSSPLDGSTLGDTPPTIRLTFGERPEPALSTIRIVDASGTVHPTGQPAAAGDDPLSLVVTVPPLGRGVYAVHWRVVSAVDGHASSGVFVFGIQMSPDLADRAREQTESSPLEASARTVFLLGVIVALGACGAFLVSGVFPLSTAVIGGVAAAAGVLLLAIAQLRVAGVAAEQLVSTAVGAALLQRAYALGVMAVSIAVAWQGGIRSRRVLTAGAAVVLGLGSLMAIAAHAAAGHAAAGRYPVTSTVTVHSVHVAAAGLWLGSLASLLVVTRHRTGDDYARAFRRFSAMAGLGLVAVAGTGLLRSLQELPRWSDLGSTQYGVIVAIKGALLVAIAALGARNFFRNVKLSRINAAPLKRAAGAELVLAVAATAAAGWLGTLSPPAAAIPIPAIEVSGEDFGTTVRATLQVMSNQPGPNRFTASVTDYDSGDPVAASTLRLRFTPIDDPSVSPTGLDLRADESGTFTGSGANLAFPGRWRVNILVERAGSSVDVPLLFEVQGRPQAISVLRPPSEPVRYTAEIGNDGFLVLEVESEREGASELRISAHNLIHEPMPVDHIVVTAGELDAMTELVLTRQDRNSFSTATEFRAGKNRIGVVVRGENGIRLHAHFEIDVSLPRTSH